MKEEAYNFWTKSKLKEILDELSCDYRSSWSKGKLVSALCEQPVEAVLDTLKSTELKELLEELEASSSGNKAARKKRLLGLLTDGGGKKSRKQGKSGRVKKVEPLSREEVLMLAQVLYKEYGNWFEDETCSFVEVSTNLGEFSDYKPYAEYTKVLSHIDTGTLVGLIYWQGGGDCGTVKEPFLIESRTTKVTMRIFKDKEGGELFRVDDSEVKVKKKNSTMNAEEERELIVEQREAEKRRLAEEKEAEKRKKSLLAELKKDSLSLVEVPAGSFMMGALPNDEDADDDEKPRHKVTLTKGMLVSKYSCTQGLYEKVMGENPSDFKGSTRPVECVSWCDAVLFCNKLGFVAQTSFEVKFPNNSIFKEPFWTDIFPSQGND